MSINEENNNITESEIFNNMINKIDKIKNNLIKLKTYSEQIDNIKSPEYLDKLTKFSYKLNNIFNYSKDMYDQYILQLSSDLLNNRDKNKQHNLQINKKMINYRCETI